MKQQSILVFIIILLSVFFQPCKADLVGHWTFNEGSGTTAYDSVDSHDGTIYGAEWTTNGALSFDGVGDYVEVPDADRLDLTVFTLEVRFQINALPAIGQTFTILSKGEDLSTDHANYYLTIVNSDYWGPASTKIACVFEDNLDYDYWLTFDIDESYVGRPVSIISTLEGNDWNMYIDRSKVAATIYLNDRDNPITLSGQVPAIGNSPLFFGTFGDRHPTSPGYFSGLIDEVRIYDHALTEAEIVPVPSAVVLGSIGLIFISWKLRRRKDS